MKPDLKAILLMSALLVDGASLAAQPEVSFAPMGDESANFVTEILLDNLDNPVGLALSPTQAKRGPYELFVAESGAGRVLHVSTDNPGQVDEAIVGFPVSEQLGIRTGPLGIGFINRKKIVVGVRGEEGGSGKLVGYTLAEDASAVSAAEQDHSVGPLKSNLRMDSNSLGFLSLATTETMCYVSSDTQGLVLKAGVEANRLAYLQRLIDTEKTVGIGVPGGVAVIPHPRPAFLVVGLMGSLETVQDSRLAFFVPASGKLALSMQTGLHDIISLAYSPSGQLYAADFSWQDENSGGIYRIDDARIEGTQTCRAVKIASVVRPMSLTFTPDGSLFVAALGSGENTKQGQLVKITGEL